MTVRHAKPADAAAIHRVSVASCRAAYADILEDHALLELVADPSRVATLEEWLAEADPADAVHYLVDVRDERIVGFAQLLWGPHRPDHVAHDAAFLKSLYVHPDHWNEGVGSRLLEAGIERLPETVSRVQLGVLSANERGKAFYERRGFRRVDSGTFEVDETVYPTDIYSKGVL